MDNTAYYYIFIYLLKPVHAKNIKTGFNDLENSFSRKILN